MNNATKTEHKFNSLLTFSLGSIKVLVALEATFISKSTLCEYFVD